MPKNQNYIIGKSVVPYKEKLIKAILYHYPEAKIYLFGSWATGKAKESSDIDLAVDIGQIIDFYEFDRMRRTIENLDLPIKVDLVDLNNIDNNFKQYIAQEMIAWKD